MNGRNMNGSVLETEKKNTVQQNVRQPMTKKSDNKKKE